MGVHTYLWKTDTQLRGPLAHCARYESNLGCSAWMKGPMRGILKVGPAMEPFCLMYMTERRVSCMLDDMRARRSHIGRTRRLPK